MLARLLSSRAGQVKQGGAAKTDKAGQHSSTAAEQQSSRAAEPAEQEPKDTEHGVVEPGQDTVR